MPNIEEQIREIEEEIKNTPYNKKSQHHIGLLKAKMARLRMESEKRKSSGGTAEGYAVRKSGNATVALVGFPSVGKSTVLNRITNAESEVGAYAFTTLTVIPGLMEYKGAKIQILDLPGLIKDASRGKGRGREVISVVRTSDLIVLMVDVFENNVSVLLNELHASGIRTNTEKPNISISRKPRGGISVNFTVKNTKLTERDVKSILGEFQIYNADVVIREDADDDRLIDAITGNRTYVKAFLCINKLDLASEATVSGLREKYASLDPIAISAEKGVGLDELKEKIYRKLSFIRVYMKPPGREADMKEPMLIRGGSTIGEICDSLHRDLRRKFRYAIIWGPSSRFPGQTVGVDHAVADGDIISIIARR
ncbi:MAG: GTP-binding protein [Thermoplasmata archaeon]|uniref:GTP-binding protein n=1 Tax=Candidatus Sysuiplasma superficiale TaxID=2823368 RepID=A0A8J7YNU9_9ARCH|nr:GTP-binding protein [Candidatus Sysuiplasma superficiale]MBX8643979.1 GTP-binding protein [Candidatus Sysuiplasma superficiale]MCL4346698.1 GTP-binding protein [Candidatus Thermoplasmatota archaeon]MCL5437334.1 GTP-binding protein [Candidatus Thermoplasmatota archaeon]